MSLSKFNSTFEYKLIYIFRINDKKHNGCLKIGDATIHTDKNYSSFSPNCHELNHAARERIDSYTSTAGIVYELLYTEIALFAKDGKIKAFRDYNVHEILKRSGIKSKYFDTTKKQNEWFITDLNTAKLAIDAVKNGKTALNSSQITNNQNPIIFRPEQLDAIKKTIARYKKDTNMLWNAKMRFGKTLTALQVAKEMGFKRTIIITHRPVVSDGWFEAFGKIFYDKKDYFFGSKTKGKTIYDLINNDDNFVYFASMQDLRGSDLVGGNFDKNNEIFKTNWDFVVVDEAHEGTKTKLGKNVLESVIKDYSTYKTYVLELSGTPFNLLTDFENESIYTWDYIMEQEAKKNWTINHYCDSNPYEELPRINIYTYHLEKSLPAYIDVMDKAFNFKEFFRLWTGDVKKDGKQLLDNAKIGTFIHEEHIKQFLDLICKKDDKTNYPFSTDEYRNFFRHSLWVVPGVKEAKALSELLRNHHIFKHFTIVNVAGDGDEEIDTSNALQAVKSAMTSNPENTYTITLSCGRLTTGVSVPEWTAVLMLAGSYSTAASQYLQTIFRVQTPANINGKIKEECYVFDFAPDRTLKMVAESVQLSARTGSTNQFAEITLGKFLNFCPVISIDDSNMKEYKVAELLQELKKAYAERVARNGFDDPKIYNDQLLKLTSVELKEFENLKKIVGNSKQTKKIDNIDINKEGFNKEETERERELNKKPKKELTPEEKAELEELKEKRKNRNSAISILRAISIRMPLLVYGMNIDIAVDVTIDNFTDLVDDISWEEFMPSGVDKNTFKYFSKYYDKDIFIAASRRIRYIAKNADELEPTERVQKIASLFATFKNPDKETVLTPWRVVNLHMGNTLGGWDFFDEMHEQELSEGPRFVNQGIVTKQVFNNDSNILEINSKSGLYPVYITYSLYRERIKNLGELSFEKKYEIWDEIVSKQIFVICKTPMAKQITKRTLIGYRNCITNMHAFDDLIMQLKEKPDKFIDKVLSNKFWNKGENGKMKFNSVVGNPPYQSIVRMATTGNNNNTIDIYPYFRDAALKISNIVSLIYPAKELQRGSTNLLDKSLVKVRIFNGSSKESEKNIPGEPSVFGDAVRRIPGDVGVYLWNKTNPTETIVYQDTVIKRTDRVMPIRKELFTISNKLKDCISSKNDYSIRKCCESYFVEKNPGSVLSEVSDRSKNTPAGYTKVITNDKAGSGGKAKWYYIKTADLDYVQPNKYKVIISSAFPNEAFNNPKSLEIIDKDEMFGRTKMCVYYSDNKDDAVNFKKYLGTKFVRLIVMMTPYKFLYYLPNFDLIKNEIDWNKSIEEIDSQLFTMYKFDNDEITVINSLFE